ncbi:hypothetical protein JQN58_04030 [Aneurinibacillus sp. BA2021]|nr:hypothetical protein [Aneurinibacillus sp. BA2021]
MKRKIKVGALALFVSLTVLTGCNTKVIEHENQALKTELENVKKQLGESRQQTKQVTEEKAKLEKAIEPLKSAEADEQTLPHLAYFMEQYSRLAFRSAYESSLPLINGENGAKVKEIALTQFKHALAPHATQEYIDGEVGRLEDSWKSKNQIIFPVDKVKQITMKQKDEKHAVIEALITRSSGAQQSAANQPAVSEDMLMTIAVDKTDLGWKLVRTQTVPVSKTEPTTAPISPTEDQTNKPS